MAKEMTQAQKMAKARESAIAMLNLPENKVQVGVGTFVVETPDGFAKVAVTAVKAKDFDPEEAQAEFEFERNEAKVKADKRKAEAEAKKAADIAKKAKNAKA